MYISHIGIGNREQCVQLAMIDLEAPIQRLVDGKEIVGAIVHVYYSTQQLANEGLPVDPVLAATKGAFPVVWVAIGVPAPQPTSGLEGLEQEYQLELVGTFSPVDP